MENFFMNEYLLGNELGKGTFSTVRHCTHKLSQLKFAAKIIQLKDLSANELAKINKEDTICRKLKHPNIVEMYASIREKDYHYFIFELVSGGELFEEIVARDYFSEKDASKCMFQILNGIDYCHENNIVHRDLKPENLLLISKSSSSMVKIADFGLAIQVDDDQKNYHGFAGTPAYMSPEIIKHEPYGKPVDLWSCGVVLYVLLVGDLPFWHEDKHDLYSQIKAVDYKQNSDEFQSLSIDAKDLINKLINLDPNTRINAKTALNHHWIQNAPDESRTDVVKFLRVFNARRKLKGAIFTAMVASKFNSNAKNFS